MTIQTTNDTFDEQLMMESRNVLAKLQQSRKTEKTTIFDTHKENYSKYDKGREHLNLYSDEVFESKVNVDMKYYDKLLVNLSESDGNVVQTLLGQFYKTVRSIYEHINVEPEVYGKNITTAILTESISDVESSVSNIIYTFLDSSFYSLTPDARADRYSDLIKPQVTTLLSEGVSAEDAIVFSTKQVIVEGLLRHIAIPNLIQARINYLLEDNDYGAVFDVDSLISLTEQYSKQVTNLSKIVSTCV